MADPFDPFFFLEWENWAANVREPAKGYIEDVPGTKDVVATQDIAVTGSPTVSQQRFDDRKPSASTLKTVRIKKMWAAIQ